MKTEPPEEQAMATDEQLETEDAWAGDLASARPRRRFLTPPTVILAIVLFAVVGFLVGVKVEKGQLPASSGTAGAATGAAARRGRAGGFGGAATGTSGAAGVAAGGFGGFSRGGGAGSASGPVTTGTVSSTSGSAH
jgi:hypothetical protein